MRQGAQGIQGIQGIQGLAGLNWRGAWSSSNSYALNDAVAHQGSSYRAKASISAGGSAPPSDPTNWDVVAAKGEDGDGRSFNWQGAWDIATAYAADDVVSRNGNSYIALAATLGDAPESSPAEWSLMSQKGDTGATGATGAQGIQGIAGTNGAELCGRARGTTRRLCG